MNITKFDHSGFLLEKDGRSILFDPVEYSHKLPEINNLDAIIITHSHGDHSNSEIIEVVRRNNPNVKVLTTRDNVTNISGSFSVKNGDKVQIGTFVIEFYGENHAEIIPGQIPCQNIGTLIDGTFANSGDSFSLPPSKPSILLVPITAPWLKLAESMNFISQIKPVLVLPTHDALNSDPGNTICDNFIRKICNDNNAEYKNIHFGTVTF